MNSPVVSLGSLFCCAFQCSPMDSKKPVSVAGPIPFFRTLASKPQRDYFDARKCQRAIFPSVPRLTSKKIPKIVPRRDREEDHLSFSFGVSSVFARGGTNANAHSSKLWRPYLYRF